MQTWLKKYKIILIMFVYLGVATYLYYLLTKENPMPFLMGIFFIVFSFFKIIHWQKFSVSFKNYDLLAKFVPFYAILYPLIEIALGLMFLTQSNLFLASIITFIVLCSTNIGIAITMKKGQILECACLGVVFGIPLSSITLFENTAMITMAGFTIINLL